MSVYSNFGATDFAKKIAADLNGVAYSVGIESDKKLRGSAVNIDVIDEDVHRGLIIIVVRESIFHPRRYTRVTKQYLLCGRNENGNAFSHPIPTDYISRVKKDKILKALAWIWGVDPRDVDDVRRNGDVAFIPVRKLPTLTPIAENKMLLAGSHQLTGELYRGDDGEIYAKRGYLSHKKGQHAAVRTTSIMRVAVGARAKNYHFAQPTAD